MNFDFVYIIYGKDIWAYTIGAHEIIMYPPFGQPFEKSRVDMIALGAKEKEWNSVKMIRKYIIKPYGESA